MKIPVTIPQLEDLERVYERFHLSMSADDLIEPTELVDFLPWTRFDARLAEIAVTYLAIFWKRIDPMVLNEKNLRAPWPGVLAVLLEHAEIYKKVSSQRLGSANLDIEKFVCWKRLVEHQIKPVAGEQFFIGHSALGSQRMQQEATLSAEPYETWGYLGRDILINKFSNKTLTLISKKKRARLLRNILQQNKQVTVAQYRQELNHLVSQRQAERDLRESELLKPRRHTRGRFYVVK